MLYFSVDTLEILQSHKKLHLLINYMFIIIFVLICVYFFIFLSICYNVMIVTVKKEESLKLSYILNK